VPIFYVIKIVTKGSGMDDGEKPMSGSM